MITADELLDLCRQHFDPRAEPITHYPGHEETTVLRAATRDGEVIVKIHRDRERHNRERNAYRHWAPMLAERTPRLLAEIADPPAVILTALPGAPVAELTLPPEAEHDVFGQAGAILAAWQAVQPPRETPNMTAWLADRGEKWLQLAEPILPAAERAEIRAHLRALAALGPLPVVPCHLDFTPRNLMRAPDGAVRVIDFVHARYDLAARDLVGSPAESGVIAPTSKTPSWPATGRYPIWTGMSSSTAPTWTASPPPCAPPAATCPPSPPRNHRSPCKIPATRTTVIGNDYVRPDHRRLSGFWLDRTK